MTSTAAGWCMLLGALGRRTVRVTGDGSADGDAAAGEREGKPPAAVPTSRCHCGCATAPRWGTERPAHDDRHGSTTSWPRARAATLRDEAPQALPIGFLFAGAPSVVCSLWAVGDDSTKELMVDYYRRLLAGDADELAALHAAKQALRVRHPEPFHWAPFLFLGSPA